MNNLAHDSSGARRIPTRNLAFFVTSPKHCFQFPATFCQETPVSTRVRCAHKTLLGLPWPLPHPWPSSKWQKFFHLSIVGRIVMVKAIDSRAECLWLESRGSSFSKVLTHLPLLREAGVISVPWCWYCALADLAPPCAPYKDNISMRKGMKKPLAASGRVWQGGLELMKRYLTDLAVERKRSCPSQHQTSLASMTSQSLKSIKKPLATSVLGSNVPWS